MSPALRILFGAALALSCAAAATAVPDDSYLAGYATAVIERDLGLRVVHLEVRDRVAHVVVESLGDHPADRIAAALQRIEGIESVVVSEAPGGPSPDAAQPQPSEAETPEQPDAFELLPRVELFEPLTADPRWPHFSASYVWYLDDPELTRVASTNFGETFALLGGALLGGRWGRWEFGWLGGVFSIFDLDAPSSDLVNTDFWTGPTLSARRNGVSGQLRLYHQSSHLGDEFLLRTRVDRVNLSYEGLDLLLSWDVLPWLRLYGGGGVLVHSEQDLDPLSAQAGIELKSPVAFLGNALRPIAAFDFATREENDWHEELSAAAGLQLENPRLSRLRVQLLVSYFKGNSPNGQFFERRIETIGVGVHLHF